jgi:hypothetical protein
VIKPISYPLKNVVLSVVKPGRLRWIGPWLPRMTLGRQDLEREMRPLKIRWGWVLLLATAIVLALGECGPAASAIDALPQPRACHEPGL